ncbi:MAG: aldo/keto reductase [Opitutaceae bacterium]|jgi:predicted aldo/keto reductase-like oxidoreductase|nr:aldo/keto reductase [Opitutaceae bacterium]
MRNNINRRRFLRYTATGGAGLLVPASLLGQSQADSAASAKNKPAPKFEQRTLGRTGMKLPILSMGVMRADNPNLVRAAMRSGIVHFDTANGYQKGNNETMLGRVFKDVPRDSFTVATKINLGRDVVSENAPAMFMERFNTSMGRLGLEYVDILFLHAVDSAAAVLHGPILEVMQKLKKEGRVRHTGVSTHKSEPEVIDAVVKSGVYEVALTAYNFRQEHVTEMKAAVARAAAAGIGVIAMKTMAGAKNVNVAAALKWALQDKNVSTAIPGFTNFEELDVCLEAAANLSYTPDEKSFMAQAGSVPTLYCQQCDACAGQCPQDLPIPDLMRAYMYAHGYRNPGLAKETLAELSLPDNPCSGCAACTVQCRSGFNVGAKIADIARVRSVPDEFLV